MKMSPVSKTHTNPLRILITVASYGNGNHPYLEQLLREYRSMPFEVDVAVFSNIPKELGPDIEVIVGLPTTNPRSLPFAPRPYLASKVNDYDLFIYCEDDTPVTARNIAAFCRVSEMLGDDEVAGFLRIEKGADGSTHYPDVHHRYHWDAASVKRSGDHAFAYFTNEHAACYVLTRAQLSKVVGSGGFLVQPHEGKYDMLETAATDPYTQCGLRKLICISHLDEFLVHHLPNKYVGSLGVEADEVDSQVAALTALAHGREASSPLFDAAPARMGLAFSKNFAKNFYEPVRSDVLALVETQAKRVLSIGCGWGAAEDWLVAKGVQVTAVPVDSVIAACAEARGVSVVLGGMAEARQKLEGQKFDCLLLSNVLHLVDDPVELLSEFADLLTPNAIAVAVVPNLHRAPELWQSIRDFGYPDDRQYFEKMGLHRTSRQLVKTWFNRSGFCLEKLIHVVPDRIRTTSRATLGLADAFLASELVAVARATS